MCALTHYVTPQTFALARQALLADGVKEFSADFQTRAMRLAHKIGETLAHNPGAQLVHNTAKVPGNFSVESARTPFVFATGFTAEDAWQRAHADWTPVDMSLL